MMWSVFRPLAISGSIASLSVVIAAPLHAQVPPPPLVPRALHGVWVMNSAQCAQYLAARRRSDGEAQTNALIGAVIISARLIHAASEYGEGNFYEPTQVVQRSAGRWQMSGRVGIDTIPVRGDDSPSFVLDLRMAAGRLLFTEVEGRPAERLRLCTRRLPAVGR